MFGSCIYIFHFLNFLHASVAAYSGLTTQSSEAFHKRNYFYVGGHTQNYTENIFLPGHVLVDQIYVEELIPPIIQHQYPLVFWPGNWQTSTNFLNTPDGRQGWASFFLSKGYVVYLVDQPQRGRSPWLQGDGSLNYTTIEFTERYFTATERYKLWPQAGLHTQWVGTGVQGDPVFDALFASQVQAQANGTLTEINNRAAGAALLDRIGPVILVTHSQAGPLGWGIVEVRPSLVKGVVAIEPSGPPFLDIIPLSGPNRAYGLTSLPLTYDPPVNSPEQISKTIHPALNKNVVACTLQTEPARKLVHFAKVPVMMVTSESGFHSVYDYCTVEYLKQGGVTVDWLNLTAAGVRGNGHFVFLEKNSAEIVLMVESWVTEIEHQYSNASMLCN